MGELLSARRCLDNNLGRTLTSGSRRESQTIMTGFAYRKAAPAVASLALGGMLLAACQQETTGKLVTEAPSLVLRQADRVVQDSTAALRSFLTVVSPGTTCMERLRKKGVVFTGLPDKENKRGCGYTNAVEVSAFGEVSLSKKIILRCQVAERVSDWLTKEVQPTAQQVLQTRVTRMLVSSGYRCRNAFGLRGNRRRYRLSQHAHANAFDIWGMEFANGRHTRVRDDWKFNLRAAREKAARREEKLEKLSRRQRHRLYLARIEKEKARDSRERSAPLPKKGDLRAFWRYVTLRGCNIFNKVFSPESDRVHHNHVHFDLSAERLCGLEGEWHRHAPKQRKKRRRIASAAN